MQILFVRSDKIGSKFIRWGFDEPASHVAISFNSGRVFHSYGVGIMEQDAFMFAHTYTAAGTITLQADSDDDLEEKFRALLQPKSLYDYPALLYFGWRVFLFKFFGQKMPKINRWNQAEKFLCTEVSYILCTVLAEKGVVLLPANTDIAMISPWQLFLEMEKKIVIHQLPFRVDY